MKDGHPKISDFDRWRSMDGDHCNPALCVVWAIVNE